jgi:rhodanese-related sulfurtransferase
VPSAFAVSPRFQHWAFRTSRNLCPSGGIHTPLGALRGKCEAISKDKEILAFCKVSLRGYEAQRILDEKGFRNVSFIGGGLVGWPFELRSGS